MVEEEHFYPPEEMFREEFVNVKLVEELLWRIERLKETSGLRIFKFELAGDGAVNNWITKILTGE